MSHYSSSTRHTPQLNASAIEWLISNTSPTKATDIACAADLSSEFRFANIGSVRLHVPLSIIAVALSMEPQVEALASAFPALRIAVDTVTTRRAMTDKTEVYTKQSWWCDAIHKTNGEHLFFYSGGQGQGTAAVHSAFFSERVAERLSNPSTWPAISTFGIRYFGEMVVRRAAIQH